MSLNKLISFISLIIASPLLNATPPVEVIGSCKNQKPVNTSVIMTQLISPKGVEDIEQGCDDHYEATINNFTYGSISCNNETNLIIKGNRYNLNSSINNSVNPSITPESEISAMANWSKIDFSNNSYICIDAPLSFSGDGANVHQYYIVENAYNSNTPIINYYFFNKDIMPMTSTN